MIKSLNKLVADNKRKERKMQQLEKERKVIADAAAVTVWDTSVKKWWVQSPSPPPRKLQEESTRARSEKRHKYSMYGKVSEPDKGFNIYNWDDLIARKQKVSDRLEAMEKQISVEEFDWESIISVKRRIKKQQVFDTKKMEELMPLYNNIMKLSGNSERLEFLESYRQKQTKVCANTITNNIKEKRDRRSEMLEAKNEDLDQEKQECQKLTL